MDSSSNAIRGDTFAAKKTQESNLDVAHVIMVRWMSGVTTLGRMRNDRIRGTTKAGEIAKAAMERKPTCHGHVMRREEDYS